MNKKSRSRRRFRVGDTGTGILAKCSLMSCLLHWKGNKHHWNNGSQEAEPSNQMLKSLWWWKEKPGPRILESWLMRGRNLEARMYGDSITKMAYASEKELMKGGDRKKALSGDPQECWPYLLVLKYWGWEDWNENQFHLKRKTKRISHVAQWIKDLALSLQWLEFVLWCRSDPWLGNFYMLWVQGLPPQTTTKKEKQIIFSTARIIWFIIYFISWNFKIP